MGLFSTLLEKLGFKKEEAKAETAKTAVSAQSVRPTPTGSAPKPPTGKPPQGPPPVVKPGMAKGPMMKSGFGAPTVDVVGKLEKLAGENKEKLEWKKSVVDLMKLVGMDSSLEARKEMAKELGCPENLMGGDNAEMNVWLHKAVLHRLAENGGNIPQEMLK